MGGGGDILSLDLGCGFEMVMLGFLKACWRETGEEEKASAEVSYASFVGQKTISRPSLRFIHSGSSRKYNRLPHPRPVLRSCVSVLSRLATCSQFSIIAMRYEKVLYKLEIRVCRVAQVAVND